MPFTFEPVEALPGLVLVTPRVFEDDRGSFLETYKRSEFEAQGITGPFVQDNRSVSRRGVLRGLHYQAPPMAQGKLVRCLRGTVYDVALDIRSGSPTFGHWYATRLGGSDPRILWVPEGFAHGFCALEDDTVVEYKVTAEYSPDDEGCIRWDDPELGIDWPIEDPVLAAKDAKAPVLTEVDPPFEWTDGP